MKTGLIVLVFLGFNVIFTKEQAVIIRIIMRKLCQLHILCATKFFFCIINNVAALAGLDVLVCTVN